MKNPERKREIILKAIADVKKAEPYSPDEVNQLGCEIVTFSDHAVPFNRDRYIATLSKALLDKHFAEHPEDTIENYLEE